MVSVLYGVRVATFNEARDAVEQTLHIILEERESSHHGGIYFRFDGRELEELILQENIDVPEMEPAEEEFPDRPYLLYASGFPKDSPLLTALQSAPELFETLRTERA